MEELLGSQRVGAVAVGNETEVFRELPEVSEGHAHRHGAGTHATVVRELVSQNGAFCGIHDEPNVSLETADLDISLVRSKSAAGAIIEAVCKRLYADGGGSAVVGNLLVGDGYAVKVLQCLGGLAQ